MILDEIEPIIEELSRLKTEIGNVDTNAKSSLVQLQADSEATHKLMYGDLEKVQAENDKNFNLIIKLCHRR
jgi:hypothetical protein